MREEPVREAVRRPLSYIETSPSLPSPLLKVMIAMMLGMIRLMADNDHVAGPGVAARQRNLLQVEREVPRSHQGFLIEFVIHVIFVAIVTRVFTYNCLKCHHYRPLPLH